MTGWEDYPEQYRAAEIGAITSAVAAGDCVSVVGLSGAGKSNLLGFLAHHAPVAPTAFVLVDSNRLAEPTAPAFLRSMQRAITGAASMTEPASTAAAFDDLETALSGRLVAPAAVCFVLDLSTLTGRGGGLPRDALESLYNNLRALRDAHKYQLTYVVATRRPLPPTSELAELFFGRVVWLGPLAAADAQWTVARYAARQGLQWPTATVAALLALSGGYPALLRAACEAHAAGAALDAAALAQHPAVQRRVLEFWEDEPVEAELEAAGLLPIDLLMSFRAARFDTTQLTAKENLLLSYLTTRPAQVCEKDDLVRAVWPDDRIYERGVRDDSLAQLVRRLREKIEPDPASPRYVHTVAGRGYRFTPRPL